VDPCANATRDHWRVSSWFRTYGFADVHDDLLIGAYPLDREDVKMLRWIGVERILNLVEDSEYGPGERDAVHNALAVAGIEEYRQDLADYGGLPSTELEQAVQRVVGWLEEGKRVYLHCRAGWQRSAAVAAGVVAIREHLGIDEALEQVQLRKPNAEPLPHQREDLVWWWEERGWDAGEDDRDAAEEVPPAGEDDPHATEDDPPAGDEAPDGVEGATPDA
jgi:protein-tyrosine phosphatase